MNFSTIFSLLPLQTAYAHCDIPCGVYDPHTAQMAAHTVLRMTQLYPQVKRDDEVAAEHTISRLTHVKEEHGAMVEKELGTLKNDYFKEEHFKENPNLENMINEAIKLSVKCRQEIDLKAAEELLTKVQEIAEVFFKTKGVASARVPSLYPTGGEIVIQAA